MVLLFFQIRYQLLSFDENLISDTLGLLFPASVIGFIIGIVTPPFFVHYYNRILYIYKPIYEISKNNTLHLSHKNSV